MKSFLPILIVFVALLFGCQPDYDLSNEEFDILADGKLNVTITEINTQDPVSFSINQIGANSEISHYTINSNDNYTIEKRSIFRDQFPNGEDLDFDIWFRKEENPALLNYLAETENQMADGTLIRYWQYEDNNNMVNQFYLDPNGFGSIEINNFKAGNIPLEFKIIDSKMIRARNRFGAGWIKAEFSGELYHSDTPGQGKGYQISGTFEGVL